MFDFFDKSPLPSPVSRLLASKGRGACRAAAPSGVEHKRLLFVRWLVEHRRLTDSPVPRGQRGDVAATGHVGPGGAGR